MIIMAMRTIILYKDFKVQSLLIVQNKFFFPLPSSAVPAACLIDYSIGAALTLGVVVSTRALPVENN